MTKNAAEAELEPFEIEVGKTPSGCTISGQRKFESTSTTSIFLSKLSYVRSILNVTLPPQIRSSLLDLVNLSTKLRGPADTEMVPPLRLRRIIGLTDNFGLDRAEQLIMHCGLKPYHKVLDVGCGCGGLAVPLARYLNSQGWYEGFDIIREFIDWLKRDVTGKYPNFRFQHANVWNSSYNPKGEIAASKYKFPYKSESFDVVFLGSVFTHMLPKDLENYLSEIARVLKSDGKCLITYFLLTPRRQNVTDHILRASFMDTGKGYSIIDKTVPENAVAYKEEYLLNLYRKNGLKIIEPIIYGNLQDIIVAGKY